MITSMMPTVKKIWTLLAAVTGVVLTLHSCTKDQETVPLDKVLEARTEGIALADSSSTVTLVATLVDPDVDRRNLRFRIDQGVFVNASGQVIGGNIQSIQADAEGIARAYWRAGRQVGTMRWSVVTEDSTYRRDLVVDVAPAYPDRIVLSAPTNYTDSAIAITASLFRSQGWFSRGLPLTFRAWQQTDSIDVPAGNFATSPVKLTTSAETYPIVLDLSGPSTSAVDTVLVGASCGSVQQEEVLQLFLIP